MNSKLHVLKIHPQPLADLISGVKTGEVRKDDRGFQVGDTVSLVEVNPDTGNWKGTPDHVRTISHIQRGYGLPDGLCVLSYAPAVEAAKIEVAEGFVLVPKQMYLEPEDICAIAYMCGGDPDSEDESEHWLGGVLWVGECVDDDGSKTYGLNIACQECLEEGSVPVHEFAAPLPPSPAAKAVTGE